MRTRSVVLALFAVVLALGGAACSKEEQSTVGGGAVNASLKEFSISVTPASVTAGKVTFSVKNEGTIDHEFVVFKTDLAPAALPTTSDGLVDEAGAGVTLIDELEDLKAGTTTPLEVTPTAGKYVLLCNVAGHYKSGMAAGFTAS